MPFIDDPNNQIKDSIESGCSLTLFSAQRSSICEFSEFTNLNGIPNKTTIMYNLDNAQSVELSLRMSTVKRELPINTEY